MASTSMKHARLPDDGPLGKPPSMTETECGTLFVRRRPVRLQAGTTLSQVSRWTPTAAQRAAIGAGDDVYLEVLGGHPPVMLYVGDPVDLIQ